MREGGVVWMSRKEAAEYLCVSLSCLAHMPMEGMGPRFFRAGGKVRYRREDLDRWAMGEEFEPLPMSIQNFVLNKRKPGETEAQRSARLCAQIVSGDA